MKTFKDITNEMFELYSRKNNDYGNSFSETYEKLGLISAVVRMQDKMNRIIKLSKSKNKLVNDESIEDTIIDLANYAVMTLVEISKTNDHNENR